MEELSQEGKEGQSRELSSPRIWASSPRGQVLCPRPSQSLSLRTAAAGAGELPPGQIQEAILGWTGVPLRALRTTTRDLAAAGTLGMIQSEVTSDPGSEL